MNQSLAVPSCVRKAEQMSTAIDPKAADQKATSVSPVSTPTSRQSRPLGLNAQRVISKRYSLKDAKGTVLVMVNSVCGCAAGRARPGVKMALRGAKTKPDQLTTVFAGQDREATQQARSYFGGNPPTSPQVALFKDGQLVYLMQRHQIEGRDAPEIAEDLMKAFEKHCSPTAD